MSNAIYMSHATLPYSLSFCPPFPSQCTHAESLSNICSMSLKVSWCLIWRQVWGAIFSSIRAARVRCEEPDVFLKSQMVVLCLVCKVRLGAVANEAERGQEPDSVKDFPPIGHGSHWRTLYRLELTPLQLSLPHLHLFISLSLPLTKPLPSLSHLAYSKILITPKIYWEPSLGKLSVHIISFQPFSTYEVGIISVSISQVRKITPEVICSKLQIKKEAESIFLNITLVVFSFGEKN